MSVRPMKKLRFGDFLVPNRRPHTLGPAEDANLVGMRLYAQGPFHRELKAASAIRKKSHFVIREGDVIYNKLFAWKGTFGIVPEELDGMFVSDKFPTYKLDESLVLSDYLDWYFKSPSLWDQAKDMSTGSAALSKLTLNPPKFLELTIPVPEIAEQRLIADRLNTYHDRLEEIHTLRSKADSIGIALRNSMLRQFGCQFESLGRLERVLRSRPRNGWSAKCDNAEGGTCVLSLSAVTGYEYKESAVKRTSLATRPDAHYWLNSGDLLITRSNTPELVGHAAIYSGSPSPCIYPDLMMRLDIDETIANKRFVWFWLQTPTVRRYIYKCAKGTSPTMKKISQGTVNAIPFPDTVSLSTQEAALQELERNRQRHREMMEFMRASKETVEAILPSLFDQAFHGDV